MSTALRNMATVYLMNKKRFLLLYREGGKVINNVYIGSAGGHFEANELNKSETCVLREMKEEIGVTSDMIENLALRYVVLRNVDGEIRQNYYFFADLKDEYTDELQSNEGNLRWVDFDGVLTLEMPYTAKKSVEHFLKTGRFDSYVYGAVVCEDVVDFVCMK